MSEEVRQLLSELQQQLKNLEERNAKQAREKREGEGVGLVAFYKSVSALLNSNQTSVPIFVPDDWVIAKALVAIVSRAPVLDGTLVELLSGPAVLAQYAPRDKFKRIVVNDTSGILSALVSEALHSPEKVVSILALLPASKELVSIANALIRDAKLRGLSELAVASLAFYALHANPLSFKYKYHDALVALLETARRLRDVEFTSQAPLTAVDNYASRGNTVFYIPLSRKFNLDWAIPVLDKIVTLGDYWMIKVKVTDSKLPPLLLNRLQTRYRNVGAHVERKKGTNVMFFISFNWASSLSSDARVQGIKDF